jgi:hypothetical protein
MRLYIYNKVKPEVDEYCDIHYIWGFNRKMRIEKCIILRYDEKTNRVYYKLVRDYELPKGLKTNQMSIPLSQIVYIERYTDKVKRARKTT